MKDMGLPTRGRWGWRYSLMFGAVAIPAVLYGLVGMYTHREVIRSLHAEVGATADVLVEHARKVFEMHNLMTLTVDERVQGMSWAEIERSSELHKWLAQLQFMFPQAKSIALISPDGVLRASSALNPVKPIDLSSRDYFRILQEDDVGTFVGERIESPFTGAPIFNIARRRSGSTEGFDGVITITSLSGYFNDYWSKVRPSDDYTEILLRQDGTVLAREPKIRAITKLPQHNGLLLKLRQGDGEYQGISAFDNKKRLYAFRKVGDYPVWVAHSRTIESAMQVWEEKLLVYGLFFGGAMIGLGFLAYLALRNSQRETAARLQWQSSAQRLLEAEQSRAHAESQLRQAQKMEVLGQIAGGMAHDFGNLMQIVIASLDRLKRSIPEDQQSVLHHAIVTADKGASLIRAMMSFARQQPLQIVSFNLRQMLEELGDLLHPAVTKRVALTIKEAPRCIVRADRAQLELAILNLALNAKDAMPNGGSLIIDANIVNLVGTPDQLRGEYVEIEVTDFGTGIEPSALKVIFEPFFTTKAPGKGTGLGLSMVYGFVKQSRGTITVDSKPGRGTTFRLYLPLERYH